MFPDAGVTSVRVAYPKEIVHKWANVTWDSQLALFQFQFDSRDSSRVGAVIMSSRIPPRLRDLLAFFHSVHRCYPH